MKKTFLPCLLCVVFLLTVLSVNLVYAIPDETITFYHSGRIFTYSLSNNIKNSTQFDLNYEINKYNRFGSTEERIELLKHMDKIGIDRHIALDYLFPNLLNKISSIEKNIYIKPQNAKLAINSNTEQVFHIKKEIIGITLDKQTLYNQIFNAFTNKSKLIFNLPTKSTTPEQTTDKLKSFTNLRADFSTNISSSSQDRKHNIKNALISLNKVVNLPNQIFSFNKTVGRRTAENGYRQAKIIVNNEFVDGIGGGVCQVSSTLYNSAILAGLKIIEANKHSKQVNYVKSGFDAMVNFGSSDLKILNNTSEKITIITNYSSDQARIRIFGESLGNTTYKRTNEIFNISEPTEEIFIDEEQKYLDKVKYSDEFFYLKKASKGMEIKSYRETYKNGELIEKELLRHDKYKVQNSVKVFGSIDRSHERDPENLLSTIPFR